MHNRKFTELFTSIPNSLQTMQADSGYWSDLSFLAESSKTLHSLKLKNNQAESLILEALQGFQQLSYIEFEDMHIKDYSPLYALPALEWLVIKENECIEKTLDVRQLKMQQLFGLDISDVAANMDYLNEIELSIINVAVRVPNIDFYTPCSDKVIRQLTSRNRFAQTTEHILCVCSSSILYAALWADMNIFNTNEMHSPPIRVIPGMRCTYNLPYADIQSGIRRSRPFEATMIPINMDGISKLVGISSKIAKSKTPDSLKLYWDDLDQVREEILIGSGGLKMGMLYFFIRTGKDIAYIQQIAERFDVIELSMLADSEQNRALLDIAHKISKPAIVTNRSECMAYMEEWEDCRTLSAFTRKEKYEVLFGTPKELLTRIDPEIYITEN